MKRKKFDLKKWAKDFEKSCKTSLNNKQMNALTNLALNQEEIDNDETVKDALDKNKLGLGSMIYHRCFSLGVEITNTVALWLGGYVLNTPGDSTMYSAFLKAKAVEKGVGKIDLHFLCGECIPWGFPSENDLNILWGMQKVKIENRSKGGVYHSDNYLDYKSTYKIK